MCGWYSQILGDWEDVVDTLGNRVAAMCPACGAVHQCKGVFRIRVRVLVVLLLLLLRSVAPLVSLRCHRNISSCFPLSFLFRSFFVFFRKPIGLSVFDICQVFHASSFSPLPCVFESQPWLRAFFQTSSSAVWLVFWHPLETAGARVVTTITCHHASSTSINTVQSNCNNFLILSIYVDVMRRTPTCIDNASEHTLSDCWNEESEHVLSEESIGILLETLV